MALAYRQTVAELRHKVAVASRIAGTQNLMRGATGHVSARIPGADQILIKAKGLDQTANEFATERDIILIDIEGQVLEAPDGLTKPNETEMHLAVYRRRPEVGSVIHCHPDWAVLLMATEKDLTPLFRAFNPSALALWEQGLAIFPRSVTITTDELGAAFAETMGERNTCLLLGHGYTTVGKSVEEATAHALNLQDLARMNYLAYTIGKPQPIPDLVLPESERRQRAPSGEERIDRRRPGRNEYDRDGPFWRWQQQILEHEGRGL